MERRLPFSLDDVLQIRELAAARRLATDRFRVVFITRGGMGACARIENEVTSEPFALKVILPDPMQDSEGWARYLREIQVWMACSAAEGVVEAYCVTRVNEVPCVAARWMAGGNLRRFFSSKDATLFYRVAVRIARSLSGVYEARRIA
jgi:hypothetical protein